MRTTKVYLSCDSSDLLPLREAAERLVNEKGCHPTSAPWPLEVAEGRKEGTSTLEKEVEFTQKIAQGKIASCDLFVAMVGDRYGKIQVPHPFKNGPAPDFVSPMHYELLRVLEIYKSAQAQYTTQPEILIFSLDVKKARKVETMLSEVLGRFRPSLEIAFEADKEFNLLFSRRLTEYRQNSLTEYLESLRKFKISVTCDDRPGLLAILSEVVNSLNGSVAGGSQTTNGNRSLLQFVAEWQAGSCPKSQAVLRSLQEAFSLMYDRPSTQLRPRQKQDFQIDVTPVQPLESQFSLLLTFVITFIDQPSIAEHIFTAIRSEHQSVHRTQVDTFLSGGIMLGRIQFSLRGDGLGHDEQMRLEKELRKLPGILHVDSTALRGRFWK